jgi:2-oxoglutarate ferredoxin oxidoreductase subunit delta
MGDKSKQFEHVIRDRWCKGCDICVAFCPKKVLALKNGKVAVEKPGDCVGCRFCELRCPDFAIEVQDKNQTEDLSPDVSKMDLSVSPEVG